MLQVFDSILCYISSALIRKRYSICKDSSILYFPDCNHSCVCDDFVCYLGRTLVRYLPSPEVPQYGPEGQDHHHRHLVYSRQRRSTGGNIGYSCGVWGERNDTIHVLSRDAD